MCSKLLSAPAGRLALFLCTVSCPVLAQVVVRPFSPAVPQGQSVKFTANQAVTWSLAPGSPGSIDPDGTYHAPSSVVPSQSIGGCQIFSKNNIFNIPIDNLPKHPQSDDFIAWTKSHSGGNFRLAYGPGTFPVTYVSGDQQTTPMKFFYDPDSNGPFPIPPYPEPRIEGGYWNQGDRHVILS
jgi:hypothetical protein